MTGPRVRIVSDADAVAAKAATNAKTSAAFAAVGVEMLMAGSPRPSRKDGR